MAVTRNIDIPFLAEVQRADQTYWKDRGRELEYEFTKRKFYADPNDRGIYGVGPFGFSSGFGSGFSTLKALNQADNGTDS